MRTLLRRFIVEDDAQDLMEYVFLCCFIALVGIVVWQQIVTWVTQGTAQGPLWQQIAVTLEEAVLGFVIGVVLGVIFGVVLGRNRFLADVLSALGVRPQSGVFGQANYFVQAAALGRVVKDTSAVQRHAARDRRARIARR